MPRTQSLTSFITFAFIAMVPLLLHAQGSGGFDLDKMLQSGRAGATASQLLQADQIPTDNVVDARQYRLGPGDVLAYQGIGLDLGEKLISVTPENTVLIERFGMLSVEGMTLAVFRDTLTSIVRARNPAFDFHVALRKARLVYVQVSGNVPYPGTYAVPASMRVSTFLSLAFQPWSIRTDVGAKELSATDRTQERQSRIGGLTRATTTGISAYARRNIVIRGRGAARNADLVKALVTGFEHLDPHLREEDHVTVPFDAPSYSTVSVGGAFATPGTIPWKRGDIVDVLLAASGGLTENAHLGSVRIERLDGSSISVELNGHAGRFANAQPLEPGDVLLADAQVAAGGEVSSGIVDVSGEVLRAGAFRITPGVTRVARAIEMAGGVTPQAALNLAYIVRQSERTAFSDHPNELLRRFQYSDLALEDTVRYRLDQVYRLPTVSCDIAKAMADTTSQSNVVLFSGDKIIIPARPTSVFVYGQVTNPGYVQYQHGKTLDWYVFQAGGYAVGAKQGRARIVRGRTNVWERPDSEKTIVEPGDEVYVPRAPDVPAGMDIQYYAVIGGVVSSIAALAGVLYTILR
jgi:protein involved in polysaccharide export with SLBB domain